MSQGLWVEDRLSLPWLTSREDSETSGKLDNVIDSGDCLDLGVVSFKPIDFGNFGLLGY
ncbi:MAG: hypothetical protein HLUCCO16_12160 [Phormidium sp. OSCR]|nr:MAG: hypothetical protein HLUCCO16_12160 [Phormidium sp. OSCR]